MALSATLELPYVFCWMSHEGTQSRQSPLLDGITPSMQKREPLFQVEFDSPPSLYNFSVQPRWHIAIYHLLLRLSGLWFDGFRSSTQ